MTSIEWTDATWNPVVGCSIVSAGCSNCYAMKVAHRGMSAQHRGLTVMTSRGPKWNGEVRFVPEKLGEPLSWKKPRRVFVNSMSDLFHEELAFEQIAAVFGVMAACPQHTFQVLTKRPERARDFFAWAARSASPLGIMGAWAARAFLLGAGVDAVPAVLDDLAELVSSDRRPLPNVWLGVSAEDQKTADERIPILLELPAAVRFVSAEPLLGPLDLSSFFRLQLAPGHTWSECLCAEIDKSDRPCVVCEARMGIDWVIVGGESGPGARPCDTAWIRSIVERCASTGVACFVKQLGAKPADLSYVEIVGPDGEVHYRRPRAEAEEMLGHEPPGYSIHLPKVRLRDRKGGDPSEWPEDLRVRAFPEVHRAG